MPSSLLLVLPPHRRKLLLRFWLTTRDVTLLPLPLPARLKTLDSKHLVQNLSATCFQQTPTLSGPGLFEPVSDFPCVLCAWIYCSDSGCAAVCSENCMSAHNINGLLPSIACPVLAGTALPRIVDLKWRLDYVVATSDGGKVGTPLYLIDLHLAAPSGLPFVHRFTCTPPELEELRAKVKDALRAATALAASASA